MTMLEAIGRPHVITVKNWHKFQHFKDRKPPWVKLYRDLLDDVNWHTLDPSAAKILVMLWLIASEDNGKLPDAQTLSFRLRLTKTQVDKALSNLEHWLDISVISEGYQEISATDIESARRDREREETEREKEAETKDRFDEAWLLFGRYGVKKKAKSYWAKLSRGDRLSVIKAIPAYLKCVAAGRTKSQFEGWINPENRKWDVDWTHGANAEQSSHAKASGGIQFTKERPPQ